MNVPNTWLGLIEEAEKDAICKTQGEENAVVGVAPFIDQIQIEAND